MALHFQEGRAALIREITENPYNLMPTYLSDYEDCLSLLLNADKLDYEQRKDHLDERIERLSNGDKNSPWYRFCKAGIYLHWSMIHFRFGEQFKAATTFRKSYALMKENQKLFPDFEYNKMFFGLEEAFVETIPDNYKWLASIFGMKGNVKKGMVKLSDFINTHTDKQPLRIEGVLFYVYLRFYLLSEQKQVWDFINSSKFVTRDNLLYAYVKANIALNYRKCDVAIETLKEASADKDYNNFPFLNYVMGASLLCKLDTQSIYYFNRFLKTYKGNMYEKDAWYKMALVYYLQQNMPQAEYCRRQIKKNGNALFDVDRYAARFAESSAWSPTKLLQAHLLIDGGYYSRASAILLSIPKSELSNPADRVEYYFRMGRLYDETENSEKAIEFYEYTIRIGRDRPEHFAARSALQLGMLYERSGNKTLAIEKYKECLSMRDHDFQNSLDQQAKSGINRLKK